jgi:hypothetical protein
MKELKELSSESFGLIIAYLLPGLVGLFSLSLWSYTVRRALEVFLTAQANFNLLLLVILAALAIGLLVTALRWLLLERLFSRANQLTPSEFASLGSGEKFVAFVAAVDAHYRYHQFFGGMAIVIPVFYCGWLKNIILSENNVNAVNVFKVVLLTLLLLGLEWTMILAAKDTYHKFVNRARNILRDNKSRITLEDE